MVIIKILNERISSRVTIFTDNRGAILLAQGPT